MTPLTDTTLHHILAEVIITGFQCARPESDIKSNAEAAARAFRAGLVAFTAPAEPVTGGHVNTTLDVTRHYGGVVARRVSESSSHMPTPICNGDGPKDTCICAAPNPASTPKGTP